MQLILDIVVSAVSIGMMGCFTWSLRKHFVLPSKMPEGALLIMLSGTATAVVFLYLIWAIDQPALCLIVGLLILCAGSGLFFAAIAATRTAKLRYAFTPDSPHGIVTDGPYRYLRHPFYASYLTFWTGWAIAAWSPWATLPIILYTIIYVLAARSEERRFSGTSMAKEYAAYKERTGFLWPRLGRVAR